MNIWKKALVNLRWMPAYYCQQFVRRSKRGGTGHVMIAVADHFEPSFLRVRIADTAEQQQRVERWCRLYPEAVRHWRDADGYPWRHTYFYPAEQMNQDVICRLVEFCHSGWGDIEIQLHHGIEAPDDRQSTRKVLVGFRDALAARGCLSKWEGQGGPQYAFVHGNWALANSNGGRYCGVDDEVQILAETGCYADFTLPSAPNPAQVTKINALYECALPLSERAPHRRGRDLCRGRAPRVFPLIIQGPLLLKLATRNQRWRLVTIENGMISAANPPSLRRFQHWCQTAIGVEDRPDWLFVKLYCHGMDPLDENAFLDPMLSRFLRDLTTAASESKQYQLHFVTAREMVNIALAACDGRDGNPGDFRDYRLKRIGRARDPE